MILPHAKYYILLGHYGSGKTELALALARYLRAQSASRTVLVDMDIVNPYFRSAEQTDLLKSEGIEVLMPSFAMSTVDIPALPADMQSIFVQDFAHVIMDVGGDDTGATVLGRYHPELLSVREQTKVLYVVNPLRPFCDNISDIAELFRMIESRARIKPDVLVNNANLQRQTTVQDILDAQKLLLEVSETLGIPIGMIAGEERLRNELPSELQDLFFPFVPVMKPDWLEDQA